MLYRLYNQLLKRLRHRRVWLDVHYYLEHRQDFLEVDLQVGDYQVDIQQELLVLFRQLNHLEQQDLELDHRRHRHLM